MIMETVKQMGDQNACQKLATLAEMTALYKQYQQQLSWMGGNLSQAVKRANKCIECGFCEVNCMSCGLTLSSRMRIAVQREIRELEATGSDPERAARLRKQYKYYGDNCN